MSTAYESQLEVSVDVPARAPYSTVLQQGQELAIIDLGGNQAVDFLCYDANDTSKRYSAAATIAAQGNIFLTTGSVLRTQEGAPLLTVVADTCGRHDTLGGACATESNTVRYALEKRFMHACRDNFCSELSHREDYGLAKRDIVPNINFFMNVPVTAEGKLTFEDGISAPGKYVELRAEMDVVCLISNCPQLNNPCNAYNPTPIRLLIWDE